jgi:hypothetical protein
LIRSALTCTALEARAIFGVLYISLPLQMSFARLLIPAAQAPPNPPSPVIASVTWDFESLTPMAQESDLFPLTWADNDHLYTAWGDGWGFSRWSIFKWASKKSLGVSRVLGLPPLYSGTDLWSGIASHTASFASTESST